MKINNLFKKKVKTVEDYYVKPHHNKVKKVLQKHVKKVLADATIMHGLCYTPRGHYPSAFAVAHPQIKKHALAFFVLNDGEIIINPTIINHTNQIIEKEEGCMSMPDKPMIKVGRWHKCEVEYQTIENGELTEPMVKKLSGKEAQIFQHEFDHLEKIYIYDKIIN